MILGPVCNFDLWVGKQKLSSYFFYLCLTRCKQMCWKKFYFLYCYFARTKLAWTFKTFCIDPFSFQKFYISTFGTRNPHFRICKSSSVFRIVFSWKKSVTHQVNVDHYRDCDCKSLKLTITTLAMLFILYFCKGSLTYGYIAFCLVITNLYL